MTATISGCAAAPAPIPVATPSAEPRRITSTLSGAPIVAGAYLFWKDTSAIAPAIYGYDVAKDTQFVVLQTVNWVFGVAGDETRLVWFEELLDEQPVRIDLHVYDIATRADRAVLTFPQSDNAPRDVAVDGSRIYYTDSTPGHTGLFIYNLETETEQLLSATGRKPVANDGVVLWLEPSPVGRATIAEVRLRMRRHADGAETDLARAPAEPAGDPLYAVSGDYVVWVFDPLVSAARVMLHRISTGVTEPEPISPETATSLTMHNDQVLWVTGGTTGFSVDQKAIQSYNLQNSRITTFVAASRDVKQVWGVTNEQALVFTLNRTDLYIKQLE
jgi:hypothetical protein